VAEECSSPAKFFLVKNRQKATPKKGLRQGRWIKGPLISEISPKAIDAKWQHRHNVSIPKP
jgi:hypothetical protein